MADPTPIADALPAFGTPGPGESVGGGGQPTRITVRPPTPIADAQPSVDQGTPDLSQTQTTPPTSNAGTNMMTDIENMMSAAMQGTTPDVSLHTPNYLGDAYNIDDGGEIISYKDKDGNEQKTDSSKQIALRDPETGKYQVFQRTDQTNEDGFKGKVLALGRYLNFFNSASAPGQIASATKGGEMAATAARQGVDVGRGITSPVTGTQSRAILASKIPWVGSKISDNASKFAPQLENVASNTAAAVSPSGIPVAAADAGEKIREGVANWRNVTSKARVNSAYDAVDKLIDPAAKQRLDNTWDVVSKLQKKYKDANILNKSPAVKEVLPTLNKPGGLDYPTLKFVRTRVGKLIENPGKLAEGINEQELKQIYGGLTEDLGKLVNKAGKPGATNAWKRAGQLAKATSARRELLDATLGNTSKSDEGLFGQVFKYASNASTANIKALSAAKRSIPPEDWQEISASVINKLGRTNSAQGSQLFDPAKFAKDYNSLSTKGKDVLFGAKGSQYRQSLDDIAYLSSKGKDVAKMSHAAKGHGAALGGGLGVYAAAEGIHEIREMVPGGGLAHLATALTVAGGAKVYANMLAKPAGARAIARWMKSYVNVKQRPGANTVAAYHNAAQTLGTEMEAENKTGHPNTVVKYLNALIAAPVSGIDAAIGK